MFCLDWPETSRTVGFVLQGLGDALITLALSEDCVSIHNNERLTVNPVVSYSENAADISCLHKLIAAAAKLQWHDDFEHTQCYYCGREPALNSQHRRFDEKSGKREFALDSQHRHFDGQSGKSFALVH